MHARFFYAAIAGALSSALSLACTTADTSLVGPTSGKCQTSVASATTSFGPAGGAGSLNIATARDCTWSITGLPSWVSIAGETGGQGEAVVSYSVAANPVPVARDGSISVGSATVQVKQAAAACTFALDRRGDTISAAGGRLVVHVTTLSGCSWSAVTDVPWVTIAGGSGNASGTVGLDVEANDGPQRVANVRVGAESFALSQSQPGAQPPGSSPQPPGGSPQPPQPAPPPPPPVRLQFEGVVKSMSGECPSLVFTVAGRRVATSRDTRFLDTSCRELQNRKGRVHVIGFERADGIVAAARVERVDDDNDDDDDDDEDDDD